MTTPINLNKFRKQKAKADKEQKARENRAKFGQTKSAKSLEKTKTIKLLKDLESKKLND